MRYIRKLIAPALVGYSVAWLLLTAVTWDPFTLARDPLFRLLFLLFGAIPALTAADVFDFGDLGLSEAEAAAKDEAFAAPFRRACTFLWRGGGEP